MLEALADNSLWLAIAALCALAPTALFPLLAAALSLPLRLLGEPRVQAGKSPPHERDLEILIPAYREGSVLTATLDSVMGACKVLQQQLPCFRAAVTVALHGADEETMDAFSAYVRRANLPAPLRMIDGDASGKWPKLEKLVEDSQALWCALVDAGTLWPQDLLTHAAPYFRATGPAGLAPGYQPSSQGLPSRAFWALESTLKRIENLAGGPVSVHGATVFYRAAELRQAFAALKGRQWLNDDVAIALTIRTTAEIEYRGPSLKVGDIGIAPDAAVERTRRRRMMEGNLQWLGALWPMLWRKNPMAALIACRRAARVFWAPLALMGAFSLAMALQPLGMMALCPLLPFIALAARPSARAAFAASLRAPMSLLLRPKGAVRWV